jgi:DNA polymerase-3 subunit gamma/tau
VVDPAEPSEPAAAVSETYQSLYRRYRPQRFSEVLGQDHVTRALRNSVRNDRVAHAYLFSGPRGTGKTSTARILAMALNCEHPDDGEPDGVCASCVAIRRGSSMDVTELDAASNRRLEEMRDLLSRVALGTPGRWKIYIIDEVHQLTADAASALLKTLEEPPAHVVFVLATTDPQKVLPTIRSRTQSYEFRLLSAEVLSGLLADVNQRASLGLGPEDLDEVLRRGNGSARDALSALDQVAAAGGVENEVTTALDIIAGLAQRDVGRVLVALAEAMSVGRDPRRLATDLLSQLREGFLAIQAPGLVSLPDAAKAGVEAQARQLGVASVVRAMEVLGETLAEMRDSVDPRISLEVALVRLALPAADISTAALVARIEQLERMVSDAGNGAGSRPGATRPEAVPEPDAPAVASRSRGPAVPAGPTPVVGEPTSGAAAARAALGAVARKPARPNAAPRSSSSSAPPPLPSPPGGALSPPGGALSPPGGAPSAPGRTPPAPGRTPLSTTAPSPSPASAPFPASSAGSVRPAGPAGPAGPAAGPVRPAGPIRPAGPAGPVRAGPSRDELTKAWGDGVLQNLPGRVRSLLLTGRFIDSQDGFATFALPDPHLVTRAERVRVEAEAALAAKLGSAVRMRLVLDAGAKAVPEDGPYQSAYEGDEDPVYLDRDELVDAGPEVFSPEQKLFDAFPGSEEVQR